MRFIGVDFLCSLVAIQSGDMVEGSLRSVLQRRLIHHPQRTHYYFEINLPFIFVGGCTGYVRFGQITIGLRKYCSLDMHQTSVAADYLYAL